jgi:hypothetical protein
VRNVQPQTPLRIGLDDVAEFPADRIRARSSAAAADPARRHRALQQPAKNAPHADVHFEDHQRIPLVLPNFERDVVHADHFAAVHVDNLLIEQIALDAQHVLVGVIRIELFVAELMPSSEMVAI